MEKISITTTITSISGASFFAYLGMNQEAFYGLTFLIFIDYLTGLSKTPKGDIRSDKMRNGLFAKMLILLIPLSLAVFLKMNGLETEGFLAGCFFLLGVAELYSIIGNIYQTRTGEKISEYDAMTAVIRFILHRIKEILEKSTNTKGK